MYLFSGIFVVFITLPRVKANHSRELLRGRRIIYVGDSTSRYEYLTLAYWAEYGVWPSMNIIAFGDQHVGANILWQSNFQNATVTAKASEGCEQSVGAWWKFYNYSNSVFNGREVCDCWRGRVCCNDVTENRIYKNSDLNLTIMYFLWFSGISQPAGTFDLLTPGTVPHCPAGARTSISWRLRIDAFVNITVRRLAPTHVFLQAGWHSQERLLKGHVWGKLAAVCADVRDETGARVFWRTSPHKPLYDYSALFTRHGLEVYEAARFVREWQVRAKCPGKCAFVDGLHLSYAANCALVQALLDNVFRPGSHEEGATGSVKGLARPMSKTSRFALPAGVLGLMAGGVVAMLFGGKGGAGLPTSSSGDFQIVGRGQEPSSWHDSPQSLSL